MNKKVKTLLATLFSPLFLFAQSKQDSIGLDQAKKSLNYYTDSVSLLSYNFAKESSYYLSSLMPNKVSRIALRYDFHKGHYTLSQGATKINAGTLLTEGATKLGAIKLFGAFSYKKTFEDSTRFSHQTRSNTSTPYYFGSPAYVHYERSVYTFKAMAGRTFFSDKFDIAIGTDYKVGNHFSTNDPRGDIGEYQFNLIGSLGYNLSKKIKIGLAYRNGYGQEKVNIGYKNPRYYESSVYPMYYNHLINGYGEGKPVLEANNRVYTDNQTREGFDVYLDINSSSAGNFYLSGNYITEHQRYFHSTVDGFTEFSEYDLNKMSINLLWLKNLQSASIGALLNYNDLTGKDFNMVFLANNYIYARNNISAKIFFNKAGKKIAYNHFIQVSKTIEESIDGVKANDISFENLLFVGGTGVRKNCIKNSFFGLSFMAQYKLPLNDTFKVLQANEAYFTRYVIYHDYLYNTSSHLAGSIAGEYGFPIFNTMQASFKINATYTQKLEQKLLNRNIVSAPGKDRFSSNISLNLYF